MLRTKGLPEDLRKRLKEARRKRRWGQRKLAAQVGLAQPHISSIESGEIVPRFDTLVEIARVLDLDLLLVPRSLVPAVQSLIRASDEPDEPEERPLYGTGDEEAGAESERHDEF